MKLKNFILAFIFAFSLFFNLAIINADDSTSATSPKTEVYHLDQGVNDYDRLLSLRQVNEINTRLQLLTRQFPDGINIVIIKEIKGYDSLDSYVKDFLAVNKSEYNDSGMIIFIFLSSKYVDIAGHTKTAKSTINYILPYKREILSDIKTGINSNNLTKGITDALDCLIQEFQIEKPNNKEHEKSPEINTTANKDIVQKQQKNTVISTISKTQSIWMASVSIVIALFIMIAKILSVKGSLKRSSIPFITQVGVDLLYFSLFVSIISAFYLFFLININYLFLKIVKVILVLILGRFIISRIATGRNWARYITVLWVLVTMYIDVENNLYNVDVLSIGSFIIYISSWSTSILGLLFVYLPVSNRWMIKMKEKRNSGIKQPHYIEKQTSKTIPETTKQNKSKSTSKSTKSKHSNSSKSKSKSKK